MNSPREEKKQTARLSIADRCAVTYNRNGLDAILLETDNLADTISRAVGAKQPPERARGDLSPAYELASLLMQIRRGIVADDPRSLPTLDAAIELAFLHSETYRLALELFRLDLSNELVSESGSAHDLLAGFIAPAQEREEAAGEPGDGERHPLWAAKLDQLVKLALANQTDTAALDRAIAAIRGEAAAQ